MDKDQILNRLRGLKHEIYEMRYLFLAPVAAAYIYVATAFIVLGSIIWFRAVWPVVPLFFIVNSWLIWLNYKAEIRGILSRIVNPSAWKELSERDLDEILKSLAKSKPGP